MKLSDLDVSDKEKELLAVLIKPKSIPEICAKSNLSYSTVAQKLSVLKEKGFVNRVKTTANRSIYSLNQNNVEL